MGEKKKLKIFCILLTYTNFGFAEGTFANYVFLPRDSAIQVKLMAFTAPSVRK